MLSKRLLTAAIGIPVCLALLFRGPPAVFCIIIFVLMQIAVVEGSSLLLRNSILFERLALGIMTGLIFGAIIFAGDVAKVVVGLGSVIFFSSALWRGQRIGVEEAVEHLCRRLLLIVYVGLLFSFPAKIRLGPFGLGWVVLLCAGTWSADSGAYFSGRWLGRKKLLPMVSPGKTVAGVWGGMVVAVLVVVLLGKILGAHRLLPDVPDIELILLGGAFGLLGVAGDLFESLLKRSAGKKDSGKLFPGHGGVLDRLDALLFNSALLWVVIEYRYLWN